MDATFYVPEAFKTEFKRHIKEPNQIMASNSRMRG